MQTDSCKNCKWWGRHLVGANFSTANKQRAICSNPDVPSNYLFYVHKSRDSSGGIPKGGWDELVDFWTFEDFACKDFREKK